MAGEAQAIPPPPYHNIVSDKEEEKTQKSDDETSSSSSKMSRGSNKKKTPRYLTSPGPSCHDSCKYGTKHNFDPKKETIKSNLAQEKRKQISKLNQFSDKSSSPRERTSLVETGYLETIHEKHILKAKYSVEVRTTMDFKSKVTVSRPKILVKVPSLKRVSSTGRRKRLDASVEPSYEETHPVNNSSFSTSSSSPSLPKDKTRALKKYPSSKNRAFNSYIKRDVVLTKVQMSKAGDFSSGSSKVRKSQSSALTSKADFMKKTSSYAPPKTSAYKEKEALKVNASAKRLTFRAGKAVNPSQPTDDSPKILKFKQLKRVYTGLSEGKRWSFKRKDSIKGLSGRQQAAGNLKVALRHLEIKDKKENQSLLNEVIELTASKLAETSKSKVKALVGAFESVISLRESGTFGSPA